MKRRLLLAAILLLAGAVVNVAVAWGCAIGLQLEPFLFSRFAVRENILSFEHGGWKVTGYQRQGAIRLKRSVNSELELAEILRRRNPVLSKFIDDANPAPPVAENPRDVPRWSRINHAPVLLEEGPLYRTEDARGWPLLSLRCDIDRFTIRAQQQDPSLIAALQRVNLRVTTMVFDRVIVNSSGEKARNPRQSDAVAGGILVHVSQPVPGLYDIRALPYRPIWPGFAVNTLLYATVLWLLIPGPFVLRRFIRVRRGLCPKCAYPMGESAVCSECGKELPV